MITAVGSKEDTLAGRVRGVIVTRQGSERRVEHGMAYRSVTSVARDDALELVRSRLGWTVVAMDAPAAIARRPSPRIFLEPPIGTPHLGRVAD